ncbi:F-box only protein 2-like, partial [Carassius carassius]|uniref:F-box only protein 2-like n=1 Tax=Carassius carassius TaxID=217509 RepID=UPI002868B5CB
STSVFSSRIRTDSSFLCQCSGLRSAVPIAVVEEILLNLPAHQVVRVCRLVCHEWKELVDSTAHWRERCRREGLQPQDPSRAIDSGSQFYFITKKRHNLLKNPRAEDKLEGWKIVQNGGDRWVVEKNRNPFVDETVMFEATADRFEEGRLQRCFHGATTTSYQNIRLVCPTL